MQDLRGLLGSKDLRALDAFNAMDSPPPPQRKFSLSRLVPTGKAKAVVPVVDADAADWF